jgi:integrase
MKWLSQKKEECEAGELSWETYKDYNGYVINHYTPLETMDVSKINYRTLENFKDGLPRSLKIKTRRNIFAALHSIFRWMHRKSVIKEVPAFPIIEGDDAEMRRALTYDQQQAYLTMIPVPDRNPIEFGFEMGLRPGKTCALKIGDVDQIGRRVLIQHTWSGTRLKETTKGKRKVWMRHTSRAWEIVSPLLKDRSLDDFIFLNPRTGRPYRQKILNRVWKANTGSELVHYEASRHSFCTQIVLDGHNTLKAKELMRHADIKSTVKYFHADSDELFDAMEKRGRSNTLQTLIRKRK